MDRRTFMTWMGTGFLASSLPIAIAACQSQPVNAASDKADTGHSHSHDRATSHPPQAIGTVADLDRKGFLESEVPFAITSVVVIRNPADRNTLLAVDSHCSHRGCAVQWKADQREYTCPCHGSKFAPDGSLKKGPAKEPLLKLVAKIQGNQVIVSPT